MAGSPKMRYSQFSQDASRVATWSVIDGTEDPGYLASNLNGYDPTNPAKLLTDTGAWKADLSAHPTYSSLVGVALIHCNLDPGLEVRLQGDDDPAFGSLDADILITLPPLKKNWPINGYALFPAQDLDYWRIKVVGSNSVTVSVGHIVLMVATQLVPGAQQGLRWTDMIPAWDDVTEIDVPMNLDLLTQLRACVFDTYNPTPTIQSELDDWWLDSRGILLPFLFIPDVNVNECYWMTFQEKAKEVLWKWETETASSRTMQVKLKEFGRGMRPTPWPV